MQTTPAYNISEHIGFDGKHYYCQHCGKSGYERMEQARGHLGQCPKKIPKPRIIQLNTKIREMTGTLIDSDGDEYCFELRMRRL